MLFWLWYRIGIFQKQDHPPNNISDHNKIYIGKKYYLYRLRSGLWCHQTDINYKHATTSIQTILRIAPVAINTLNISFFVERHIFWNRNFATRRGYASRLRASGPMEVFYATPIILNRTCIDVGVVWIHKFYRMVHGCLLIVYIRY